MVSVTTRTGKGSELTWAELDANFTGLADSVNTMTPQGVAYSTTIPLDGNKLMPRTLIASATQFALGGATEGGQCVIPVMSNGVVVPTFASGLTLDPSSDAWRSVNGALHKIYAYYEDGMAWCFIKDTGITSVSATALTVSGPSSGVVGVASSTITVQANGTLASTVTVAPSSTAAGSFSPSSGSLSSGGAVTFTYTPTDATAATLTFSAAGLTSATLAYTASAAPTAPGQVVGLTLGTATSSTQPLSWTAPSDGGASISDYLIQYSTDNSTWTTFADGTSTTTSATVTGLTASTLHYYRVAAVNAVGTGSYSASSSGSTSPASLTVVRMTSLVGITESGDATNGWNYTSTGNSSSYGGSNAGVSDKKLAAGTDGYFRHTVGSHAAGRSGPYIGLKTTQATGAFGTCLLGVYIESTDQSYRFNTGSTGAQVANGSAQTAATGDMVRLRRAGSSAYAEVSKDGGVTWITMNTWAGASTADVWCVLGFGNTLGPSNNIRGLGVV